jgi:hypothetical protein
MMESAYGCAVGRSSRTGDRQGRCCDNSSKQTKGGCSMSSIIDFLERMGSEAQLHDASPEELERALNEAGIDAPARAAIYNKDTTELQALLRQVPLFSIQSTPDEDEDEDDEDEDEGEEKKGPKGARRNADELVPVMSD